MEDKRKNCCILFIAITIFTTIIFFVSCSSASGSSNGKFVEGLDVSQHQGEMDVEKIDVEFVVIRMGYRGYEYGKCVIDTMFFQNVEKFIKADKKIALYWASHSISMDEVYEENQLIVSTLNLLSDDVKSKISYIFIDREKIPYDGRADNLSYEQFNEVLCGQVHNLQELLPNMNVGIYMSVSYLAHMVDIQTLKDVPVWIAWWNDKGGKSFEPVITRMKKEMKPEFTSYLEKNIVMWQYSELGKCDGISETVDLNLVSQNMLE